ncbi:MAG: hypothetical protein IT462_00790 [Planctomycetes bacterium]|nr:hypothetical protein [Planctomycetota bacterium]
MSTELDKIANKAVPIVLHDELSEFLGFTAPGELLTFTLADAGKFAGHLCPTVAIAFEMTRRALLTLFGNATPERGKVRITVASAPDAFANGPLAQVIGYITGAAADTGFRGIGGRFARNNLLEFDPKGVPFGSVLFTRTDTGASTRVTAFSERLPIDRDMPAVMREALAGDTGALPRFQSSWARRVQAIVEHPQRVIESSASADLVGSTP